MTEKSPDQPSTSAIANVLADLHATSRWQERVYKQLHAHPELSFQETKTAALAASKLRAHVTCLLGAAELLANARKWDRDAR